MLGHSSIRGAPQLFIAKGRFVREAGKWPSCANLHRTFRLFEFRVILLGMGRMGMRKRAC